jgi:subtilase family serine protease
MTLVFNRSAAQQADLDALLAAQQNPASPQFHQWLTPAEFGARFGMADADLAKVENWLQSQGFAVDSVSPSRDRITFSGSAATVASAFSAPLHHYMLNGNTNIAPSADITLPSALSRVVAAVTNLSDFRPRPHVLHAAARESTVRPSYTSSQTGNHFLTPLDIATIYDINPAYNGGYNGAGQSIAVLGQSLVLASDVTNFQTALGQTAKAPTLLLIPNTGNSEAYSEDESESDLDLEYTTGIAPGASIYFVYVGADETQSVFDALTYAVQNDIAPIVNISYGECEPDLGQSQYTSINNTLQQAAAQGQTVTSAAGDSGSTDCYGDGGAAANQTALAVDFPSSSQYVAAVGGTGFIAADVVSGDNTYFKAASGADVVSSALSYIPEQAWNDDSAAETSDPLSSGGGGVSIYTQRPSWQTGVPGIPSGTTRLVPDIALDASPNNAPYAYCSSDSSAWASGQDASCNSGLRDSVSQDLTVAGGTSFAAPIFAGMVAIINQARGYTTGQGIVDPTLYTLASNPSTYASAFHDITVGGNYCNIGAPYCAAAVSSAYGAAPGYDTATGLGSLDFNNLLTAWPASTGGGTGTAPGFTVAATSISVTSGSTATSTVTVTPVNGYTGTIAWTVLPSATIAAGACYSLPNTSVTGTSAATSTLTITTGSTTCASGTTTLMQSGQQNSTTALLHRPASPARLPAAPVALAGLGLAALAFFRRRSRRLPSLLAILLLAGIGTGLSGCGGGASTGVTCGVLCETNPPTTTNYTVTLIGTDTAHSTIAAKATLTFSVTSTT